MNKALFFPILLLVAVSAFGQDQQNKYLFIEGTADNVEHLWYFKTNFSMEAEGAGYVVTENKIDAAHTLNFNVTPYTGSDAYQYVLTLSLYRNDDNFRLITFDFFFTSLEEMYQHNRMLFLDATVSIPILLTDDFIVEQEQLNRQWKNKWIYFRASFDYPVTFYVLQETGLLGGQALFNNETNQFERLDHKIMAMPGATVGIEFQFFEHLNFEFNFQLSMGDTRNNYFVNTALGLELKVPVKFRNIMLSPYGAFSYQLNVSSIFSEFPLFAVGPGIQVCARAGKHGALFADVKYMLPFSDAVMHNPWLAERLQIFPEPPVIHYKRSYLGVGIGYKIGILDKDKKYPITGR